MDLVTGLDIGTHTIKAVVLSHREKNPKLISLGSVPSPQPGLLSDSDVDLEHTATTIKELLNSVKAPADSVVISLPEAKVFTRVVSDLPFLTDEELSSSIKYSAEEFVPIPVDQVNLFWQILERSKEEGKTVVFVVASPKTVINKYIKVLEMAGFKPMALETDLIAAARSLTENNPNTPLSLLIDFGSSSTDFAVVNKGLVILTRSIATGGAALTRAIAQYLNFEVLQAEEYKKVYGLLENQLEGKIHLAIKPLVDIIISEARRTLQAYQSKNPQSIIKRIILSGEGAKMPGLVVYIASEIGLETQEADPWYQIQKDEEIIKKLSADAPSYSVAVGLALRTG